jgi:P-type Ca2+ transporter type 2C
MSALAQLVPTTPVGLTRSDAHERLLAEGANVVAAQRPQHLAVRLLHQLTDPLVALLLAALVVTAALGDLPDSVVIALVVVVNTAIGVTQEVRADRAIAALDHLAAPTARVVRDGLDMVVAAAEVVRGDLVKLEAGDVIPADLNLVVAHRVQVDESALTGESLPVHRDVGQEVRAGTVVVVGRAAGVAVRTGPASGLGRIAALVAATRPGPTPLQRRLGTLSRALGAAVVVLSAVVFGMGLLAGRSVFAMAITAVSLVVAAVPESLPAVVTLTLALGARRMAAEKAIPRRLHAVETMGSVTVVASDKTGTLTEGRMAVQRIVAADGKQYTLTGIGYEPTGQVHGPDGVCQSVPPLVRDLARAGLLCSDAVLAAPTPDQPGWHGVGDPLEAAIVAFAARCGLDPQAERAAWPRVAERPFDQAVRRMSTVHSGPDGLQLVVCKGAPEAVLAAPLLNLVPDEALDAAHHLAAQGMRVIAVASALVTPEEAKNSPQGLSYVGLIGVRDPVRGDAAEVARAFARAGIRLLLVTGDHPATAAAVGSHLGIWQQGDPLYLGDGSLPGQSTDGVRVFARTQPEHKLDIVAALQARGHIVAVTGDGVNDAPALRRADIGVAMGGGTEVARQAADVVLVDDNLGTIAVAVREGRRIYDNIRRFLHYGLAGGAAEIMVMLCGPFLGLTVPLLPAQILWVNLLTHGLPGVALGAEPAEPATMDRAPRSPQESVLGGGLLGAVLRSAAVLSVTVLGVGVLAYHAGAAWQSMVFVVLGLAQLGIAVAVRATRRRTDGRRGGANLGLVLAIVLSGVLQVGGVLVSPLRELLGTQPLTAGELAVCVLAAAVPGVAVRLGGWGRGVRSG